MSGSGRPRVLFLSYHLPMGDEPGAFRPWTEARLLKKAGFDVTVITSGVQYMTGKDIRKSKGWCVEEACEGIRILRAWAPAGYRRSISRRIFNYLSYALLSAFASILKAGRAERIFVGTDPIFIMPVAYVVSLIKRAPLVLDERDLFPETAVALGVIKEGFVSGLLFRMQQFLRRRAVGILAATPGIRGRLISYGCPQSKVHLLYNADAFLDEDFSQEGFLRELKDELKKDFLVGYSGGLGRANDVGTVLRAALHLKRLDALAFIVIGEGEMRKTYEDFCRQKGISNVYFMGALPRRTTRKLMKQMDVCVQPLHKHAHFAHTLTSKTFDYHGLGRPMVFAGSGDTARLLEASGGGLSVAAQDDAGLARAIRKLYGDTALRQKMGESARLWFERNIDAEASCAILRRAMGF